MSALGVTTPRRLRAARAAQRWCEANDPRGAPLSVLEGALGDAADHLGRDLDAGEVDRVLRARVDQHEQDEAQAAIESAREAEAAAERAAYLERTAERLKLTRSDPPPRGKP